MENWSHVRDASAFSRRPVADTDLLALGQVPILVAELPRHSPALDLGCGAGRSTRFLTEMGFVAVGLDVSQPMLDEARRLDPSGVYVRSAAGARLPFADASFELVFASWVVLEIGEQTALEHLLAEARRVLKPEGLCVIVTTTPEFYSGRWLSCDVEFAENRAPLRSGQRVKVRLLPEGVVLTDTFWDDATYKKSFRAACFELIGELRPLAPAHEAAAWRDETRRPPYVLYTLRRSDAQGQTRIVR